MSMFIYIKGRPEPVKVSYERGQKLKGLWADETKPRDTIVDLGDDWSGELRMIKSIVGEKIEKSPDLRPVASIDEENAKYKKECDDFRKLSPEAKSKERDSEIVGSFKLHYKMETGREAPESLIRELRLFILEYFTQNPEALNVPRELIKKIR